MFGSQGKLKKAGQGLEGAHEHHCSKWPLTIKMNPITIKPSHVEQPMDQRGRVKERKKKEKKKPVKHARKAAKDVYSSGGMAA
jgi:hypothetical protein